MALEITVPYFVLISVFDMHQVHGFHLYKEDVCENQWLSLTSFMF